jgi:hypothetical protein
MTLPTGTAAKWPTRNLKYSMSSIWVAKLKLEDLSVQRIQSEVTAPRALSYLVIDVVCGVGSGRGSACCAGGGFYHS